MSTNAARIQALEEKVATLINELQALKTRDEKTVVAKEEKPKKKRGKSGYNVYMADKSTREQAAKNLGDQDNVGQKDIMKEIGRMWKELQDDEKKEWNTKALEGCEATIVVDAE
jgi:hypothetical protein